MNKKIIVSICTIILIICSFFIISNKNKKLDIPNKTKSESKKVSDITQDLETGEYVIYNKKTGKEIARSRDKASLYIYEIDPEYNPKSFSLSEPNENE